MRTTPLKARGSAGASPRVMFVTRVIPAENQTGAKSYLMNMLRFLAAAGHEMELVALDPFPGGRSPVFMASPELLNSANIRIRRNIRLGPFFIRMRPVKDLLFLPFGLLFCLLKGSAKESFFILCQRLLDRLAGSFGKDLKLLKKKPRIKDFPISREERGFFLNRYRRFQPRAVFANYVWLSELFDDLPPRHAALKIIITHEIIYERVRDALKMGIELGYSHWDRSRESRLLSKGDVLVAIHGEDEQKLKNMVPKAEVLRIPISVYPVSHSLPQTKGRCLFVGSEGETNVDGIAWFLEEVWHLVVEQVPYANLNICGTVCRRFKSGRYHESVHFLDRLDNLGPEYSAAMVCVVPLRFGSGLKIKLIEALAHGRAVVSTSVGLQGLSEIEGKAVMRADSTQEFAQMVCRILTEDDMRGAMEREAVQYIRTHHHPETIYSPLLAKLRSHSCERA